MQAHQHLPETNRLSVITATIFLAYALIPFVDLPSQQISLQLPGFLFQLEINFGTIVSILVAILAAAGTDWLIQGHPPQPASARLPNWLLPALTAWVIGVPLTTLEVSAQWWAVFALGGLLFVLVLLAEYIVVDPEDDRFAPASVGLIAVSFALYLVLDDRHQGSLRTSLCGIICSGANGISDRFAHAIPALRRTMALRLGFWDNPGDRSSSGWAALSAAQPVAFWSFPGWFNLCLDQPCQRN